MKKKIKEKHAVCIIFLICALSVAVIVCKGFGSLIVLACGTVAMLIFSVALIFMGSRLMDKIFGISAALFAVALLVAMLMNILNV